MWCGELDTRIYVVFDFYYFFLKQSPSNKHKKRMKAALLLVAARGLKICVEYSLFRIINCAIHKKSDFLIENQN